jgi:hypothetical protein
MSERTLKQLVGALILVVAMWAIATLLSGGGGGVPSATGEIAAVFDGVSEASVTEVRISNASGQVVLAGGAGVWIVNDVRADSGTVTRFWNVVTGIEVGELVASNPANHARMGVADTNAATLEIYIGGDTRVLMVGDQGPRFGTAYVRLPGHNEVYVFEGDLRSHVQRRLADWQNRVVVRIDTSAVARVEIERDSERYVLVRGDSLWTFEGGAATNDDTATGVISELANLIAAGILVEADSLTQAERGGGTVALDADGNVLAAVTIGTGTSERWARASGDAVIYRLASFRIDRITPTRERMEPSS